VLFILSVGAICLLFMLLLGRLYLLSASTRWSLCHRRGRRYSLVPRSGTETLWVSSALSRAATRVSFPLTTRLNWWRDPIRLWRRRRCPFLASHKPLMVCSDRTSFAKIGSQKRSKLVNESRYVDGDSLL
jgi:hypothetical protein